MKTLKLLRKALKQTQTDIAKYLGITVSAYGNYELGQREPDIATLNKLADYFNVSVDYLLGRTETRPTVEQPKFLILYNSLPLTQQEKVIAYMEGLLA